MRNKIVYARRMHMGNQITTITQGRLNRMKRLRLTLSKSVQLNTLQDKQKYIQPDNILALWFTTVWLGLWSSSLCSHIFLVLRDH